MHAQHYSTQHILQLNSTWRSEPAIDTLPYFYLIDLEDLCAAHFAFVRYAIRSSPSQGQNRGCRRQARSRN